MYAFEQGQHSNQKAAKFAAMLALAGADPNKQNQQVGTGLTCHLMHIRSSLFFSTLHRHAPEKLMLAR